MMKNAQSTRVTAGEVFEDGSQLALVRTSANPPLQLLHWDGKSSNTAEQVALAGQLYTPIELQPNVCTAITFPSHTEEYGSAFQLFSGIRDQLLRCHNLDEESASLLTSVLASSWFVDCLPMAPCISISSAAMGDAIHLLRHLACYARFSVVFGEPSPSGLQILPADLHPTVLIPHSHLSEKTQHMLKLSSYRGIAVAGRGRLSNFYGVRIMAGAAHPLFLGSATQISLGLRNGKEDPVDYTKQQELAAYYQPRLLQYRFEHYGSIAASSFDVPELSFPLREVARSLGMCIEDPAIRSNMIACFRARDKQARLEQALDLNSTAAEAGLFFCHDRMEREWISVKEFAETTNAILRERGENVEVSPKRMGAILNHIGLFTEKIGRAGRGIHLTEGVRRKIHRLAREFGALSIQTGVPYCRHCGEDDEGWPGPQQGELGELGER